MKFLFIVGLVLLFLSGGVFYATSDGWRARQQFEWHYEVERINLSQRKPPVLFRSDEVQARWIDSGGFQFEFAEQVVEVLDNAGIDDTSGGDSRLERPITIRVNGENYSVPTPVEIRPEFRDGNRYFGSLAFFLMRNKDTGMTEFVVAQVVGGFRILFTSTEGQVREELFGLSERRDPYYRYAFVSGGLLTRAPVAYGDDVSRWPWALDIVYPYLFVRIAGFLGVLLTAVGGIGAALERRRPRRS